MKELEKLREFSPNQLQNFLTEWAISHVTELPMIEQIDIEKTYFGMLRWLIKAGGEGRVIPNKYKRFRREYDEPKRSTKYCDSPLAVTLSKLELIDWWIAAEYFREISPKKAKGIGSPEPCSYEQLEVA